MAVCMSLSPPCKQHCNLTDDKILIIWKAFILLCFINCWQVITTEQQKPENNHSESGRASIEMDQSKTALIESSMLLYRRKLKLTQIYFHQKHNSRKSGNDINNFLNKKSVLLTIYIIVTDLFKTTWKVRISVWLFRIEFNHTLHVSSKHEEDTQNTI